MPTKAEAINRHGNTNTLMPVFILFSLLSHVLLLISFVTTTTLLQPGGQPQISHALSVKVVEPVREPLPATSLPAPPHPEPKATINRGLDKVPSRPDMQNKPQKLNNQPQSTIHATKRHKISAIELIQKAFNTAPTLSEATEQTDLSTERISIFDLRFRKKLEQARHEQARRRKSNASTEEHPEIEMIRDDRDTFTVRIGDKCWNIPVSDESDPFDTRIVMRDFRCK